MKLAYKHRFCIWLVDNLRQSPKTLKEIQDAWRQSSANTDAHALTERTFNRYRLDAEIMMDVDIECDKSDGYRYKVIVPDENLRSGATEWMMSAFRISNLSADVRNRQNIMLESPPPAAHLLHTIVEALDEEFSLRFRYKSHYHPSAREMELIPAFVRLYKQRWYVIGKIKDQEREITCAFERISHAEVVREKAVLSASWKKKLSPHRYFEHCFGIIRQHEPIQIRFRAFYPQDAYIRDVPLHSSQQIIAQRDDYTDYEIYVRPTYDLKQEFLWHRDKLAILSPESFRQDMIKVLKSTLAGYETGENHAVDE